MRVSFVSSSKVKTHRIRNLFLFLLVMSLIASLAAFSLSAFSIWTLAHPPKVDVKSFSSNVVPEFSNVTFKDIENKVSLKGWYFEFKGSDKTVLLVHGYGRNRLQFEEKSLDMIKILLTKGYNVFALDLRNSGESGGDLTSGGALEKADVLGAIKYVKSKNPKNIVLMGFSTGASACLLAAAESPDVKAVIADTAIADLSSYLSESFHLHSHLPQIPFNQTALLAAKALGKNILSPPAPVEVISALSPRPVLFIHSEKDSLIPVSHTLRLYKAYSKNAASKAALWITEAPGHMGSFEESPRYYMDRITEFLDSALKAK